MSTPFSEARSVREKIVQRRLHDYPFLETKEELPSDVKLYMLPVLS